MVSDSTLAPREDEAIDSEVGFSSHVFLEGAVGGGTAEDEEIVVA